jgi:hypothetical protein
MRIHFWLMTPALTSNPVGYHVSITRVTQVTDFCGLGHKYQALETVLDLDLATDGSGIRQLIATVALGVVDKILVNANDCRHGEMIRLADRILNPEVLSTGNVPPTYILNGSIDLSIIEAAIVLEAYFTEYPNPVRDYVMRALRRDGQIPVVRPPSDSTLLGFAQKRMVEIAHLITLPGEMDGASRAIQDVAERLDFVSTTEMEIQLPAYLRDIKYTLRSLPEVRSLILESQNIPLPVGTRQFLFTVYSVTADVINRLRMEDPIRIHQGVIDLISTIATVTLLKGQDQRTILIICEKINASLIKIAESYRNVVDPNCLSSPRP